MLDFHFFLKRNIQWNSRYVCWLYFNGCLLPFRCVSRKFDVECNFVMPFLLSASSNDAIPSVLCVKLDQVLDNDVISLMPWFNQFRYKKMCSKSINKHTSVNIKEKTKFRSFFRKFLCFLHNCIYKSIAPGLFFVFIYIPCCSERHDGALVCSYILANAASLNPFLLISLRSVLQYILVSFLTIYVS